MWQIGLSNCHEFLETQILLQESNSVKVALNSIRKEKWVMLHYLPKIVYTLLCQIETILNFLRLVHFFDDPSDYNIFKKSHFLVLISLLNLEMRNVAENRFYRFQNISKFHQNSRIDAQENIWIFSTIVAMESFSRKSHHKRIRLD